MASNRGIVFHEELERTIDGTVVVEAGSVCPLCKGEKNINNGTEVCWKCHGTGILRINEETEYDENTVLPPLKGIFGKANG